MDFEEFFRKKRIDMAALQTVQPALFYEFKTHFVQMGEKSFDHTKKYWFNKLRHEFPLPVEPKTEKVKIDNPLAEQTITESLIAQSVPTPKLGFTPKFRSAAVPSKKVEEKPDEEKPAETQITTPKLGFTPKFKAASPPKPVEENPNEDKPAEAAGTKLGFKPKFKAAAIQNPEPTEISSQSTSEENTTVPPAEESAPNPAYKPRFKMQNLPKKEEE